MSITGPKSRGNFTTGVCIPNKDKCSKCIYNDECKEKI